MGLKILTRDDLASLDVETMFVRYRDDGVRSGFYIVNQDDAGVKQVSVWDAGYLRTKDELPLAWPWKPYAPDLEPGTDLKSLRPFDSFEAGVQFVALDEEALKDGIFVAGAGWPHAKHGC